jgi:hypothetical protein
VLSAAASSTQAEWQRQILRKRVPKRLHGRDERLEAALLDRQWPVRRVAARLRSHWTSFGTGRIVLSQWFTGALACERGVRVAFNRAMDTASNTASACAEVRQACDTNG